MSTSIERYDNSSQHLQSCKKEAEEIKKKNKPLYDFLRESNIANLVIIWEKNKNVRNKLSNLESLKEQYPEYAYILINKADEVKKEIFLHNHKPLIDALSTHYGSNFQEMTFNGIRNFFEVHKNDFKEERIGVRNNTLIYFVNLEDITTRHVPTLKVLGFTKIIKKEALAGFKNCVPPLNNQAQEIKPKNNSKYYISDSAAIGLFLGFSISSLAASAAFITVGITALTTVGDAAVFYAVVVVGTLIGYGVGKLCEKVSEEKQKDPDISTCAAVKGVLCGAFTAKYSESRLLG
ncbi:hypothetical protein [Wolbachia endosymbiont of Phyllotreta cruciferae]|uniref:hypothetical protein n=1 Tax=Wolbachia endosymbiont of Phyllotreta cruciferae TaxID=2886377 RepID=UPI00209F8171|nr:hypothetical protein [Wolbachia endosymbiont of Phyllotreta cruciferae]